MKNTGLRVLLTTLIIFILSFVWSIRYAFNTPSYGREETLDNIYRFAAQNKIVSATLLDQDSVLLGKYCNSPAASADEDERAPLAPGPAGTTSPVAPLATCKGKIQKFYVHYPQSDVTTQQIIDRITSTAHVRVDKQTNKMVAKLLVTFVLPLVMLANLFGLIFLARGSGSSMGDIVGFGKIGRQRRRKRQVSTKISFADVAGADEAVAELKEVTDYLKDPKKFEAFGASPPKGVLLFGPPGCGKTLLARAAAGESGVPFFSISGAEFVESLVGIGAARVRDLFRQVAEVAPAIVFIDEIDAVGRRREGEGATGGEREQTVNQLLVEMDGFEVTSGIVVVGATNRPDILDPALLRPGRFDRHVTVEAPDLHGREAILKLHARKKPVTDEVDFQVLARRTPGFTGADLANVVNEAALLALRQGEGAQIKMEHFSEAIYRVLHGPQRRGRIMSDEERKRLAFHEAAHCVVGAALGRRSEFGRVSIVARGRGLGQSVFGDSEKVLLTSPEMQSELSIAMAGIAAETRWFGSSSTTAKDDIEKATEIAREMVGLYGMSPELGRVRMVSSNDGYLGGDKTSIEVLSGETLRDFDREVKKLIDWAEAVSLEIIENNREVLESLASTLETEETIEGQTLDALLSKVEPAFMPTLKPAGQPARARSSNGKPRGPRIPSVRSTEGEI